MKRTRQVNVHQAKTELSKLLLEVERGREVVIARDGSPVAKLVPFPPPAPGKFRLDSWKGRIVMAPDFDAPLGDDELRAWGM